MRLLYLLCALYCPTTFAVAEVPESGKERVHLALIRKVYTLESIESMNVEFLKATVRARMIEDFWRYYARDEWDIKVTGYVLPTVCSPMHMFCKPDIRAMGLEENYFQIWYRTRPKDSNICGWGEIGLWWSNVYEGCHVGTSIHELGHNLGLRHANKGKIEYLDRTSIMGASWILSGLNSMNMVDLGLREWEFVTYSQQLLLVPIELAVDSLHEDENQYVVLDDMALSLRKGRGHKFKPAAVGKELYIHEKLPNFASNLVATLKPGDVYHNGRGTRIDYLEYANETALVNVDMDDGEAISIKEIHEDLPCCSVLPESGLYWVPDFNGQGFSVHRRGNKLAYVWFTYNQIDPGRRFYVGNNTTLHTTQDGTFMDPMLAEVLDSGLGQFNEEAFVFNTPEHGRGSTAVQPLAISDSGGLWYSPSRDGEGFSIHYISDKVIMYWFTYGPKPPRGPYTQFKTIQTQRWYMMSGTADNLTIYEPQGGEWLFFDDVELVKIGTASLIDDVFTYDMINYSGSMELEQLF